MGNHLYRFPLLYSFTGHLLSGNLFRQRNDTTHDTYIAGDGSTPEAGKKGGPTGFRASVTYSSVSVSRPLQKNWAGTCNLITMAWDPMTIYKYENEYWFASGWKFDKDELHLKYKTPLIFALTALKAS